MNFRVRPKDDPEINLISLVDIFLLLLVFFMISTTFLDEARIKIRLPEASVQAAATDQQNSIEVTVTADGDYQVNGQTLINSGTAGLTMALLKVAGDSRAMVVTLRADGRATHQSVVTAMDAIGRMGFKSINIATVNNQTGR